jgi:hypothetical protein
MASNTPTFGNHQLHSSRTAIANWRSLPSSRFIPPLSARSSVQDVFVVVVRSNSRYLRLVVFGGLPEISDAHLLTCSIASFHPSQRPYFLHFSVLQLATPALQPDSPFSRISNRPSQCLTTHPSDHRKLVKSLQPPPSSLPSAPVSPPIHRNRVANAPRFASLDFPCHDPCEKTMNAVVRQSEYHRAYRSSSHPSDYL